MAREILYIDMDGVLVDFMSGVAKMPPAIIEEYAGREDEIPGVFAVMEPMPGALAAYRALAERYDTYILSTASWHNPTAWSDKVAWVHRHLGEAPSTPAHKRLILSHHKHLHVGDYLIDDREKNGADRFSGELIRFGSQQFPDWGAVRSYLLTDNV